MDDDIAAAIQRAQHEFNSLRKQLAQHQEELFSLAQREVIAARGLEVAKDALKAETHRHPQLEQALIQAKFASAERARVAAENTSSCGCCG